MVTHVEVGQNALPKLAKILHRLANSRNNQGLSLLVLRYPDRLNHFTIIAEVWGRGPAKADRI